MDTELIEHGRHIAEKMLIGNGDELGILGSSEAYKQVWARDSMIAGLGLELCQDDEGHLIHRRSLETLRQFQSQLGKIPHNVGLTNIDDPALVALGGRLGAPANGKRAIADTTHAGCVDSNLWYILGHYYHYRHGHDTDFLRQAWPSLEQALLWLRYQDSNECGLLEVHEAMDWADLFSNRYNVLYDNVLYYAVWKAMGHLADALGFPADEYTRTAEDVRRKINILLWVGPEEPKDWDWVHRERQEWLYPLRRAEVELVVRPFYLPYMGFRDCADRFDTLGNLLAILFGVADARKTGLILDYIHSTGLNEPFPVRATYPVIHPGDQDWREYFRVRNLNLPHHYHNGGAWPFIGGFYVAALIQAGRFDEARYQLAKLVEMNRRGIHQEWEFNEWFHGQSGRPMGFAGQSWSAAMYLFAVDAVRRGAVRVFDPEGGWGLAAASR
ncbi:MAG: GH116 family glycosyl hydrolase [Anaerolineae bacterium]|nr:GH116 family glycosyl hydrolase [Anaerolineae bacterium]